jgi:hypothetical protein
MNIIEKFTVKNTNKRIVDDFDSPLTISKLDDPFYNKEPFDVYELQLLLRQRFVADNDTYERAIDNAKKQASFYLYDDVLKEIQQAISAVYEGDREKTLSILYELKTNIIESIK